MTTATMEAPPPAKMGKAKAIKMPLASLRDALTKISPALSGPATIPVLKSVRVESLQGLTTFTATNLDLSIRVAVDHGEGNAEAFLIPSERFLNYVKLLQGDDASIAPNDTRATLKCSRSVTQFPKLDATNFPKTRFGVDDGACVLPQATMRELLKHTLFAVSDEENRYMLNGALLEREKGSVSLVATDGHRLARFTVKGEYEAADRPLLLPMDLMEALLKVLGDGDASTISISEIEESIACEVPAEGQTVSLSHRKLTGHFPNYKPVIPAGAMEVHFQVQVDEVLAALTRCVAMSDKKTSAVKLTFAPNAITMKAVDADAGETEEVIEAMARDEFGAFSTGFNGHYLIDALKRITGTCVFEFKKAAHQNALKITHETEAGGEFVYVVMPMRV